MKNKLLILLLILLSSCDVNLPMDKQLDKPYVVVKIEKFYGRLCKYDLTTGTGYAIYMNDITVIDSIGKFAIGDSLQFSINKRK